MDHTCPHHQGLMWHKIETVPYIYQPVARNRNWARASGMLVGGVISLFVLVLFLSWVSSVLLYHISHRMPGPTEIETPVPIEACGVEPNLNGL
jgi:hypothetical protein